jgi:hypothetical protein
MKQRCYNPSSTQYKNWGDRGIQVCDEWKNSAKTFIEWALLLWEKGLQIDRRDNDGNYCPENCRFVTAQVNNCNTRLIYKHNTSGYRGISWNKEKKKWAADISINNKKKYLGYFDSPVLAALRYDAETYRLNDGRPKNFL